MKYLYANVLSCSDNKNDKGLFKADLQLSAKKKLQSGEIVSVDEILTISSTLKLSLGFQYLKIKSEYNIDNKVYITIEESSQALSIKKQP